MLPPCSVCVGRTGKGGVYRPETLPCTFGIVVIAFRRIVQLQCAVVATTFRCSVVKTRTEYPLIRSVSRGADARDQSIGIPCNSVVSRRTLTDFETVCLCTFLSERTAQLLPGLPRLCHEKLDRVGASLLTAVALRATSR